MNDIKRPLNRSTRPKPVNVKLPPVTAVSVQHLKSGRAQRLMVGLKSWRYNVTGLIKQTHKLVNFTKKVPIIIMKIVALLWLIKKLPELIGKTPGLIKELPKLVKATPGLIKKLPKLPKATIKYYKKHHLTGRLATGALALLMIFSCVYQFISLRQDLIKYRLSPKAELLLNQPSALLAGKLQFDDASQTYYYNRDYQVASEVGGLVAGPKFSATFAGDPAKGITVTDAANKVTITLVPKYKMDAPIKDESRLIYPISGTLAAKVYSMGAIGFKEDIVLEKYQSDEMKFDYDIKLPSGTEARLENDGSIGIYGVSSELLGDVSTGSAADAQLLEKARQNATKDNLLFNIPAPFVKETKPSSNLANAWFSLTNNVVSLHVGGLKKASYPLTIDPSIYVATAAALMRGNNESNIDFDVDDELIQKGKTTGARFDAWASTLALNSSLWRQGLAVAGGYVYAVGGEAGTVADSCADYTTSGTATYSVPSGVTSIVIAAWGGGGGGGNNGGNNGYGGYGGYASATITVTAGETLNVYIGGGGASGSTIGGGGGGGYSGVKRGTTPLLIAGGGGGGGAENGGSGSGAGGNGGGTSGAAGGNGGTTTGGGGGTPSAGGAVGTPSTYGGTAGSSMLGGTGTAGATPWSGTATADNGGGAGGANATGLYYGGGGGGGGYYGGGGGGRGWSSSKGAGGGGGSSYTTGTNVTNITGGGAAGGSHDSAGSAGKVSVATGNCFSIAGAGTFTVPAGVSSVTVKAWGAGGGGGGTGGLTGGGGGYATAIIAVTANETLDVYIGGGGAPGSYSAGGGGGYSGVKRSGTPLVIAGAGGGGSQKTAGAGGAGGPGGGTSGVAGDAGGSSTGGGGGTPTVGGTAGTSTTYGGTNGSYMQGGTGPGASGFTATAVNGGGAGGVGNSGGPNQAGGGGGGGGYYGGGGGGGGPYSGGSGAGGGGGSSYITGTGSTTAGSGSTPGNSSDVDRGTAGLGGTTNVAGTDGRVVISYLTGGGGSSDPAVYWAKLNSSTNAIESPNPGNGACSGWCTNSVYNLPGTQKGFSLVAYSGFLYAIGGVNSSGTRQSSVYIAKLGANGEPQLWHPTDTNKNNWVYWYSSSHTTSTERSYSAAVAYNNRLYLLGGQTNASTGGVTTVEDAVINPTGDIGAWSATGMTALPSARHDHTVHVYNGALYLIGGNSSGTLQNTVYYAKLNSDGTMNSWVATNSFTTARQTSGGSYSTIWGSYIYLSGGCSAVDANGYCTTVQNDIQLASINADGSLAEWNTILGVTDSRIGYGLVAWRGAIYAIGGCAIQSTHSGGCTAILGTSNYGVINQDGDASTVSNTQPYNTPNDVTNPCSAYYSSLTNCNLPPAGDGAGQGGQMSSGVVINNGYIYVIGGCADVTTANECTQGAGMSGNTSYSAISSTGALTSPSYCSGTFYGHWCVDSTNQLNGTTGMGAFGVAVFNNVIYVIGGHTNAAFSSNVYRVALNANGSLAGAWTSQTFANLALGSAKGYSYAFTRANPSSAATYPGNLYVLGGCSISGGDQGIACNQYYSDVYKCNIMTTGALEEADANDCDTAGQQQIDSEPGTGGTQGLGLMAGVTYANYIYLIGGSSPNESERGEIMYAKIDNSNNIVAVSGGIWQTSPNQMSPIRRRGYGFAYNGYLYSLAGYSGSASLQDLLFAKINVSDGSIGAFTTSEVTVTARWDLRAIVSNGYVYAIGGCGTGAAPNGCTAMQPQIQIFQLYNNDSGAPVSYTALSDDTYAASTDRIGASAAVYNGYIYVAGGCSNIGCTTAVSDVQYAAISASDGTIGTWASTTNVLPAVRTWGKLEVVGGYLYYLGGQDSTSTNEQSTVYYVGTFSSGNISAAWQTATKALGDTGTGGNARTKFGAAVWNNRIYVVGGLDSGAAVSNTVYISPQLNSGGNITTNWTSDTDTLNVSRYGNILVAYANNLYSFGGNNGTQYLNDSQYTSIGYKAGTITQSGTAITGSGTAFTAAMVGCTLQYSDGATATITGYTNGTSIAVNISRTISSGVSYVIADGSIGAWGYTTSLPTPISEGDGFAYNGYMYLIGGRSAASSCAPNTIVAPISANTTIATGNNPTGVGEWYETNQKYPGGRYGAAVAYSGGKAIVLGGGCTVLTGPNYTTGTITQSGYTVTGSGTSWSDNYIGGTYSPSGYTAGTITNVTSATSMTVSVSQTISTAHAYSIAVARHYYSTIKSQAQVARYSLLIDTDTDVFPTKWLMNGLDNSTGAEWYLRYSSMNDTDGVATDCGTADMTTWGQETNFGQVPLGTPQTYIPKDGSGNNINCARYFYFSVNIDSQQAFGYPEDVSRGPTIADLSLLFTADPSKRMRHGKTFTGGVLQPLDTPF